MSPYINSNSVSDFPDRNFWSLKLFSETISNYVTKSLFAESKSHRFPRILKAWRQVHKDPAGRDQSLPPLIKPILVTDCIRRPPSGFSYYPKKINWFYGNKSNWFFFYEMFQVWAWRKIVICWWNKSTRDLCLAV